MVGYKEPHLNDPSTSTICREHVRMDEEFGDMLRIASNNRPTQPAHARSNLVTWKQIVQLTKLGNILVTL